MTIYFTDYFNVEKEDLRNYGAFDICLVSDLPLFIDPFLLFNSKKEEYQNLHKEIINYLKFLKDKSIINNVDKGLLKSWYTFKEVKQNWLGFSKFGSSGSGLGLKFAGELKLNLNKLFDFYVDNNITNGDHIEKLALIGKGVGKDHISDLTTNLIKEYLLKYTQDFANKFICSSLLREIAVEKVRFNYKTETWESDTFILPYYNNDYVILTPRDMLTRDNTFINRSEMYNGMKYLVGTLENESLRSQINNYLRKELRDDMNDKQQKLVYHKIASQFPEVIDYYILNKEEEKDKATSISDEKVLFSEDLFIKKAIYLANLLKDKTDFYSSNKRSYDESLERIEYLKKVIEDMDGYKFFYMQGNPIRREADLQLLFKLLWFSSISDINAEVNNGRGPVDFKASYGSKDSTLIEFKLASNSKLKQNIAKQVEVYQNANTGSKSIKVIMFFTDGEELKVRKVLNELGLNDDKSIILIDARNDNKESASNVKMTA